MSGARVMVSFLHVFLSAIAADESAFRYGHAVTKHPGTPGQSRWSRVMSWLGKHDRPITWLAALLAFAFFVNKGRDP